MPEYMIGPQQSRGHHYKCLNGTTLGFTVGQSGTRTMKGAADALEAAWGTEVEAIGVGLPNSLSDPNGLLNALDTCARFVVFSAPMVPMSNGSITALLRGDYDAAIALTAQRLVAHGWGLNSAIRCGWEYNAGAGKSDTSGFPWATNRRDPISGLINGISQYKLGAAYYENIFRANGYVGYFAWCGGNTDTSALPIEQAIPTHGNPALTIWDYDIYAPNPYNGSKNNVATSIAACETQYNKYLTYCAANGILMGHGEYGQTYKSSSPYSLGAVTGWFTWFYNKLRTNNTLLAYAIHYQQNQHVTNPAPNGWPNYTDLTILDEMHQLWGAGGWTGQPSTIKATGPYPIGATGLNQNGTQHTLASMGNQQSAVSVSPTFWLKTNDPNKIDIWTEWMATFGGSDPNNGSDGLAQPDPLVIPASAKPIGARGRKHRRATYAFG